MTRRLCFIAAFASMYWLAVPVNSQPVEELVYVGTPQLKYSGSVGDLRPETLAPQAAVEYAVRIVRRGSRYYWASRNGRELQMTTSGVFVTFSCSAGFVKITNPAFDGIRKELRDKDPSERFDYVEVMHLQLGVVVYWGNGTGPPISMGG